MRYRMYDPQRESVQAFSQRVAEIARELAPRFPDIDATDLLHIVESKLRPFGSGKEWLLREGLGGAYVF